MSNQKPALKKKIKDKGTRKALGYGVLDQNVMRNPNLSIDQKAIYALFACLASEKNTCFPGRDTIVYLLGITQPRYYRHLKVLKEQGLISICVSRDPDTRNCNIYMVHDEAPREKKEVMEKDGTRVLGYGFMPYLVIQDPDLDIISKGIYAYLCSVSGAGNIATPTKRNLLYHLQISEKTFYRHLQKLIALNYISVSSPKNFAAVQYILNEHPDPALGSVELQERAARKVKKGAVVISTDGIFVSVPHVSKPNVSVPVVGAPCVSKPVDSTTNININNNKSNIIGALSIIPTFLSTDGMKKEMEEEIFKVKGIPFHFKNDPEMMEKAIKWIIDWDYMQTKESEDAFSAQDISGFNLITRTLLDMCCTDELMNLKGSRVTSRQFLSRLNENYKEMGYQKERMWDLIYRITWAFEEAVIKYQPTQLNAYLRSFLWQRLNDTAFLDAATRSILNRAEENERREANAGAPYKEEWTKASGS